MPEEVKTVKSDEEQLEEAARLTEEAEAQRIEAEQRAAKADAALQRTRHLQNIRECVDHLGLKFYLSTAELEKLMSVEPDFDLRPGHSYVNGKRVELSEMIEEFAQRHANLREESARDRAEKAEAAKYGSVRAKSDLYDVASKCEFINRFGLGAYERLPLSTPPDPQHWTSMTTAEFARMPASVKSKIYGEHGANSVSRQLIANDLRAGRK